MPQATKELRDRWDEPSAWYQLEGKVTADRGHLTAKAMVTLNGDDYSAIDYLFQECDYTFSEDKSNHD